MVKKTKKQIDEYHLMIEEVLGGMDIMLSYIDKRISALENRVDRALENGSKLNLLRKDMTEMKSELLSGLDLAFRKINEK